ncbi:MAG: peptidylprolyl isomerase [Candidatus Solibacter usitatus]|nr:peptidylprolyl isomerase [Candidatus Solibacter usitatus]
MRRLSLLAIAAAGTMLAQAPPAAEKPAREPGLYATINTSLGAITVQLFEKEAPITVANFRALARGTKEFPDPKTKAMVKRPFYNGVAFHRVIPNFMIQGGDPTGTGSYGGTIIPDEFVPTLKFDVKGRLAMANAGPRTGSTQFFITDSTPTYLNGKHTIFGQVVEGQDVVTKIAAVPRNSNDKPNTPVVIKTITFVREGPAPASEAPKKAAPAAKKAAPAEKKAAPAEKK